MIDSNLSFDENLIKLFYAKDSIFITNSIQTITSSKKDGGTYSSILSVIAKGKDTLKEICETLKEDSNSIYNFIKELIKDDVLIKRSTFQSKRNVHYEILDPILAFYYRFIRENTNNIQTGFGLQIKERQNDAIKEFIEHYFEKLCITYLEYLSKNNKLNCLFLNFENYKVENSILNKSIELDIVSQDEDHLLVGEVKFSKSKQSYRDYKNMIEDTSVPPFSVFKLNDYYLFGESGFNDDLLSVKDSNLHLIDLEKMFNEF